MRHAPSDLPGERAGDLLFPAGPPAAARREEEVTILLALYNGAHFLAEQLASFDSQHHEDWRLIVSDDGSQDAGPQILRRWARAHPAHEVALVAGPGRGFGANFLSLVARSDTRSGYYAFADQDDVWLPGKLNAALERLRAVAPGRPALYFAGRIVCDHTLLPTGRLGIGARPPAFADALAQNVAGGNTIVMNRAALRLLQAAGRRAGEVPYHDWWAYQVVSGAGGQIVADPRPVLLYRQHGGNVIGADLGLRAALRRARRLLRGDFRGIYARQIAAVGSAGAYLTPANRQLVERVLAARAQGGLTGLRALARTGLRRQGRAGALTLLLAAATGLG